MPAEIFLARHATPDWSRTDLRYDIPPGPPLTEQGKAEARALGDFLAQQAVQTIFASPMERAHDTAAIASAASQATVVVTENLTEWEQGDAPDAVLARLLQQLDEAAAHTEAGGSIAIVTHGGPIRLMLAHLGVAAAELDFYRRQFDRDNPLPPAGAWRLTPPRAGDVWQARLAFAPSSFQAYVPVPITM